MTATPKRVRPCVLCGEPSVYGTSNCRQHRREYMLNWNKANGKYLPHPRPIGARTFDCIPLTVVWQVCPCCGEGRRLHLGGQAWLVTTAGKVGR